MVLEYAGTRYEASGFAIQHNQNLEELRRKYRPGKHYNQIFSGTDTEHYMYSAKPELRSPNGTTLLCDMAWPAYHPPVGTCVTTEGESINVRFE